MRYLSTSVVAVLAVLLTGISSARATTLTFEDIDPSPASYDVMPSPYNGLTFTGWYYGPDAVYTPGSGAIDLFTDYADPANPSAYVITNANAIARATAFIFDGATFSGDSGVTFELYLGGLLVHTSVSLPDSTVAPYAPTYLASGYSGEVDTVKVSAVQGYYSMDDFTFHEVSTSGGSGGAGGSGGSGGSSGGSGSTGGGTVPEPSSYALALLGLGLMAARARKAAR